MRKVIFSSTLKGKLLNICEKDIKIMVKKVEVYQFYSVLKIL